MNRATLQKHITEGLAKALGPKFDAGEFEWREPAEGQRVAWMVRGRLDRCARYATRSKTYVPYNRVVRVEGFEYGKDQWGRWALWPNSSKR